MHILLQVRHFLSIPFADDRPELGAVFELSDTPRVEVLARFDWFPAEVDDLESKGGSESTAEE